MKKLLLLALLFSVSIANADISGYLRCGTFLSGCDKSKLNIDCQAQTFFALGYISALSWEAGITFGEIIFNKDNIKYALINYCKANPLSDTHEGAEDIYKQLLKK